MISPWALEAARLPVAFAQVREDSLLDWRVVEQAPPATHVAIVASGGCTAAHLAAVPNVARIHLVDPNPSQLALSRLKLRLLETVDPASRLALLGHTPMATDRRQVWLEAELSALDLPADALGSPPEVACLGPDYAGRYECVFAALRHELSDCSEDVEALLRLSDPAEQVRRVANSTSLGQRIDQAFDAVFTMPNLVRLFGADATRNAVEPFSRHFASRLRHCLSTLPAAENPYLWQLLAGRYPEGHEAPWYNLPIRTGMPQISWTNAFMADALREAVGAFDFVFLSNILDWLPAAEARSTILAAWDSLRPGGSVLIRQLNSTLRVRELSNRFEWHTIEAAQLHSCDRSFFYRELHWGTMR
ncbi:DUF3419 family protein [Thalassoroseus pseudoceratinae]|uniref:DUF3419 family protein n=1 Tax=Thalassoroseus pseudoceratinae TaxID=2713176 RepID=UPI00141E1B39|nr:DUF3419 family protein [Thalassoroseus pseudoceratinae]